MVIIEPGVKRIRKRLNKYLGKWYYVVWLRVRVRITKFRVRDVILPVESVRKMLDWQNSEAIEWIAMDRKNKYNIYPTNNIRADGRLEIPKKVARRFKLREKLEKGKKYIYVYVKLSLYPISREMVAYISYMEVFTRYPRVKGYQQYKIWKWYPIDFVYRNWDHMAKILIKLYEKELKILWFKIFFWFIKMLTPDDVTVGLSNRYKRIIFSKPGYNLIRETIIDLDRKFIRNENVFWKPCLDQYPNDLLEYDFFGYGKQVWSKCKVKVKYPECNYEIFLDIDDHVLVNNKFYTIDNYINEHLIPTLVTYGLYNDIYVILSSYQSVPPYWNYHIVVSTELDFEKYNQVYNALIEDNNRKIYNQIYRCTILRIEDKKYCKRKLVKIL